jgi:hypothetical protein
LGRLPRPSAGVYLSDSLKQGTRARYTVNGRNPVELGAKVRTLELFHAFEDDVA